MLNELYQNKLFYYINTNEIPGELLCEKLDIFTCENITVAMAT